MAQDSLAGYEADSKALVPRFEALSTESLLVPVAAFLPDKPARVLDVGAGTGRDAAWFAERGHSAVAVEPVAGLREAGSSIHSSGKLDWVDDQLPGLARVRSLGEHYDLVLLSAVWQHLDAGDRVSAMRVLASLLAVGGRLIISVRHGPGHPSRPTFPADVEQTIESAEGCGLRILSNRDSDSAQEANRAAGVSWTWLVFERPAA